MARFLKLTVVALLSAIAEGEDVFSQNVGNADQHDSAQETLAFHAEALAPVEQEAEANAVEAVEAEQGLATAAIKEPAVLVGAAAAEAEAGEAAAAASASEVEVAAVATEVKAAVEVAPDAVAVVDEGQAEMAGADNAVAPLTAGEERVQAAAVAEEATIEAAAVQAGAPTGDTAAIEAAVEAPAESAAAAKALAESAIAAEAPAESAAAAEAPAESAAASADRDEALAESSFDESILSGMSAESAVDDSSALHNLQVKWTTPPTPLPLPTLKRLTTDAELAVAAANVRKAWRVLETDAVDKLIKENELPSVDKAMQIAMLASVIADVVNALEAVKLSEKPLVFIRGQSTSSTTTPTPIKPMSPLMPLSLLANRATSNLFSQLTTPTPLPSPASPLWPTGPSAFRLPSTHTISSAVPTYGSVPNYGSVPGYNPVSRTVWSLYQSLLPNRKLEAPSRKLEEVARFGNFLHSELPRDAKRRIWEEFIADSREARTVEEQNELLQRLERGRGHERLLAEAGNILTIGEKVSLGTDKMRAMLTEQSEFSPSLIEAARLFLATLEPASQTHLLGLLAEAAGPRADDSYLAFRQTHDVVPELEAGLLLLHRLHNVLTTLN